MRQIISLIEADYRRYKALRGGVGQPSDAELSASGPNVGNSIAVIVGRLFGNLASRFTD